MRTEDVIAQRIADATDLGTQGDALEILLGGSYYVADGHLARTRQRADLLGRLRIELDPPNSAPPQFHVVGGGFDATFALDDSRLLHGKVTNRQLDLINWWFSRSRFRLIQIWNATHPPDSTVGPAI
jgi:hypothetical protein